MLLMVAAGSISFVARRWRQLCPGALIERSCNGGRPGIVAVATQQMPSKIKEQTLLTRVHRNLLHSRHGTQLWDANLAAADQILLADLDFEANRTALLLGLIRILAQRKGVSCAGFHQLGIVQCRQRFLSGKDLVSSRLFWLLHSESERFVVVSGLQREGLSVVDAKRNSPEVRV